ncbi:MAG: SAM-dependent methyltransferase [Planctomycetaceae bacterium]|jgi:23S rRNA (cytidine2498-2'-O)-methyltransferase|nr:SAM-dependent methyltransferase [Planctomycetaceae bacterium]
MFLFSPCQAGAETVLKNEVKTLFSDFRPAFSRPGFVSFKVPDDTDDAFELAAALAERTVFARTAVVSLGKIDAIRSAAAPERIAAEVWNITAGHRYFINRIHVFRREEIPAPDLVELHRLLIETAPQKKFLAADAADRNVAAVPNETVLDVAETDTGKYLIGVHRTSSFHSRYPGGVVPLVLPNDAASRAWLKFEEGLQWSGLPVKKDDIVLDIGAAPGGASQALLSRGAKVLGVDPGEMAPAVLRHKNFTHLRGRFNQIKRSAFKDARWLISDMNVAPNYTFDVLGEIRERKEIHLQGLLFTLKLFQWALAKNLPKYAEILRQWGFDNVQIKQLAFNRQEVMVSATSSAPLQRHLSPKVCPDITR